MPWQVEQPLTNSSRPWATVDVSVACAADARPEPPRAAYRVPTARSTTSSSIGVAKRLRRRRVIGASRSSNSTIRPSLEEVDRAEQPDPHHVDEVPVVRDDDGARRLLMGEPTRRIGAPQDEEEGDQPSSDVRAVEAGRQEEHRAEAGGAQGEALVRQAGVLVDLAADEERTHQECDDEPEAQALDVAALGGEDADLAGHRRGDEDKRVDRREGDVQERVALVPDDLTLDGAQREVHGEQRCEEHQLRAEPHDGADRHHVRAVELRRMLRRGADRSCRGGHGRHSGSDPSGRHPDPPHRVSLVRSRLVSTPPPTDVPASDERVSVLVYSDDRSTRDAVRVALGRRPAKDVPYVDIVEVATEPAVIRAMDKGGIDLAILDGEAVPAGGL